MKNKKLCGILNVINIAISIVVIFVYSVLIPMFGKSIVASNPELSSWYTPWLIFVSLTGVPILIALCYAMRILGNIAAGETFVKKNSDCVRKIAMLALVDAIFFFVGNIVMLLLNMNHPAVMLISLVISLIGISLYVAFSILAYLVDKIGELKKKTEE